MRRLAVIIIAIFSFLGIMAQEPEFMYEVGGGIGADWAYGDINRSKPLYQPALAAELLFRYNANPRWAFVAEVSTYQLKGDSKDFDNAFPEGWQPKFDTRLWQLNVRPEFHFWNYGWANDFREKKRLAPFITVGVGGGIATGDGDTGAVLTLPFGAGVKWKLSPRLNAQLTCLFTRTFGDGADGIKDPYKVESSNVGNSDWTGALVLSVTFDFKERCFDCMNKDY